VEGLTCADRGVRARLYPGRDEMKIKQMPLTGVSLDDYENDYITFYFGEQYPKEKVKVSKDAVEHWIKKKLEEIEGFMCLEG
jgi:hypothetical protein